MAITAMELALLIGHPISSIEYWEAFFVRALKFETGTEDYSLIIARLYSLNTVEHTSDDLEFLELFLSRTTSQQEVLDNCHEYFKTHERPGADK